MERRRFHQAVSLAAAVPGRSMHVVVSHGAVRLLQRNGKVQSRWQSCAAEPAVRQHALYRTLNLRTAPFGALTRAAPVAPLDRSRTSKVCRSTRISLTHAQPVRLVQRGRWRRRRRSATGAARAAWLRHPSRIPTIGPDSRYQAVVPDNSLALMMWFVFPIPCWRWSASSRHCAAVGCCSPLDDIVGDSRTCGNCRAVAAYYLDNVRTMVSALACAYAKGSAAATRLAPPDNSDGGCSRHMVLR